MHLQVSAPPPPAAYRLDGPEASALRAYEIVSDAMALFGPRGSLKAVLGYLGGRRRVLAVAQGLPHAGLYGVFRDAQLDPAYRTLKTYFGPGHAPFESVVYSYGCLYAKKRGLSAAPQGGILVGTVQARFGNERFEMTQYRCDFTGTLARNRLWLHTHWSQVAAILIRAGELFEMALAPVDDRTALQHVADLHWWLSHAMPFAYGSLQISEWLVAYVFRMRGHGGVRFAQAPGSLALVAPSFVAYREVFAENLHFIPTRAAPQPTPPIKSFVRDARLGNLKGLRRALPTAEISLAEPTGQTALHVAAREGHSRVVAWLLRHGADVHAVVPGAKQTPLHLAAREGQKKIALQLLRCGAALDAKDVTDKTPLHVALAYGHDALAQRMLRFAQPLDAADSDGNTPLHLAARAASLKTLKRLLRGTQSAGSGLGTANKAGETALSEAALAGRPEATALLLRFTAPPPQTFLGDDVLHPALAELSMAILEAGADLHLFGLLVRCQARHLTPVVLQLRRALVAGVEPAQRRALTALVETAMRPGR